MVWSKYTPLYEKAQKNTKNVSMETNNAIEKIVFISVLV